MNTPQTLMMVVFGLLITAFLLATMSDMIISGVNVKMSARLEHLADDIANAIQHMSSSTIDYSTEAFDVDIWGVSIDIKDNRYVAVKHKDTEFFQQFHIAEGITVVSEELKDVKKLCFVKQYSTLTKSSVITMMDYTGSPCDISYRDVDLRYDFDWGFEGWLQINGTVDSSASPPTVILDSALPIGKLTDVSFHDYDISHNGNKYFKIRPGELSEYYVKFDIYVPTDHKPAMKNNTAQFTLDISPLNAGYTDVVYKSWHVDECDTVSRDYQCIIRGDKEITFIFTRPRWPNITLINTQITEKFYNWDFVDTKTFFKEPVTQYPNSTIEMVTFHNFTTPEKEYINITPGNHFGRNYFSFDVRVPDDNHDITNNNVSLTLSISPFYAKNIDVIIDDKTAVECFSGEKPCFIRLGSRIMLELEPENYYITIEDPLY